MTRTTRQDDKGSMTAGGALLARLKAIGVDYIFANSGTDFPPIIEGLAEAAAKGIDLPHAIVMPHEHAAMGMAHGYYLATGRSQAVMAHTNVGLANCAIGAINAAVERVPVLLFSGRTPVMEKDRFGARTVPIGWGQEMRDQAALVREACKWDYELRFPEQVAEIADRAYAIANSSPRGPVYVSLPREVLCEPCPVEGLDAPLSMQPAIAAPDPAAIERLADLIAGAKSPVIFAQHGAGDAAAFEALSAIASDWAIPVCQYWAVQLAIPTAHPMASPADPAPLIADADLILVLDSLAPWSPDLHRPQSGCAIVQMGPDPLSSRTPVRNFRSDLSIACDLPRGILALKAALDARLAGRGETVPHRHGEIARRNADARAEAIGRAEDTAGRGSITKAYAALCLSRAIERLDATVLSELGCPMAPMDLESHRSWYQEPHAGGLGWSFPAGLGMKLADRDRLVVATMGDGSYLFSNPAVCHQIAEALDLPLLVVVLNNSGWGAVRQSVLGIYPHGHASRANVMPLTSLAPTPDFCRIAEASRAWARRVEAPADLPDALEAAIRCVRQQNRAALLDVAISD